MSTKELNGSEDNTIRETVERLLKNDLIITSFVTGAVDEDDDDGDDDMMQPPSALLSFCILTHSLCKMSNYVITYKMEI